MNLFFFVHIYHQIESEIGSCSNHHDPPQLPKLECQLTSYSHFALSLRHSHFSLLLAGCSARSHKAPSLPLGFMPLGPHNDEALFRHCTLLRHGSGIGFPVPIRISFHLVLWVRGWSKGVACRELLSEWTANLDVNSWAAQMAHFTPTPTEETSETDSLRRRRTRPPIEVRGIFSTEYLSVCAFWISRHPSDFCSGRFLIGAHPLFMYAYALRVRGSQSQRNDRFLPITVLIGSVKCDLCPLIQARPDSIMDVAKSAE